DQNTAFFHTMARHKAAKVPISQITLPGDTQTTDRALILSGAAEYFQHILTEEATGLPPTLEEESTTLLNFIPPLVSEADNQLLCASPTLEEMHTALLDIDQDSAPGPDGFSSAF
ncbi:hypothetical protein PSY31_22430, partial [Shigella flexneri]|nr:hypothetical protein [Shigella flexneri]